MMKKYLLVFSALFLGALVFGQKKNIQIEDYFKWNTIDSYQIGETGKIIIYELSKLRNDGFLVIYNKEKETRDTIPRGTKAKINSEENYVVFKIEPEYDTIRQLKIKKEKKSKYPKDTLGIYLVNEDSIIKIPKLKDFYLPESGEWMAYMLDDNKEIIPEGLSKKEWDKKKKKQEKIRKKNGDPKISTKGHRICFLNPIDNLKKEFNDVKQVYTGKYDQLFAFRTHQQFDTLDSNFVFLFNTKTLEAAKLFSGVEAGSIKFDHDMQQLAFHGTQDTSEVKVFDLFYWNTTDGLKKLMDTTHQFLQKGYSISDDAFPLFSEDGSKLYFGIWEIKREEPEDTVPSDEKFKVDIWNWKDKRVQPDQLLSAKKDSKKYFRSVYHLSSNQVVQLENDTLNDGYYLDEGNASWYFARSNQKYEHSYSWDYPWKQDLYLVNTNSGEKRLAAEGAGFQYSTSPSGRYLVHWDYENEQIKFFDVVKNETQILDTKGIAVVNKGNGIPAKDGCNGFAGWTKEEDLLFYSEKDIWIYRHSEKKINRVTRYREFNFFNPDEELRLIKLDKDSSYYDLDRCLIKAFNKKNKNTSLYSIHDGEYTKLIESAHNYTYPVKAKRADAMLFRRSNYYECRDLYFTKDFKKIEKLTDINPQQDEYNWGNVELVEWVNGNRDTLEGLFYTPENLDQQKKYPMIVYFYEEYSDDIHNYYRPKPTASIVYPTEYVSNGYIVFIPNIKYEVGHPAQSAYDCIVSGTDTMIKRYNYIDSNKLGLQGQSWGGYQTAQLVTMTDKYEAAMAGAPVSNMFSAYGGIRWNSGLSREFQYEKTQSRIGATIWEKPELYIENSPLFHLPKVKTPLLIMHNDDDGAVPWYQGIEMFMGLRRLGKPVWMLNYNGDEHNLMKTANRIDLSIRMKQFFDHFLMGKPMPEWLEKGIPATEKGKITGY
ncbi:MAG: prolyl oligopeptidase family serine peptidase [Crocinitomicaceae bacterium]